MEQKRISPNPAARSALDERRRSCGRGRRVAAARRSAEAKQEEEHAEAEAAKAEEQKENVRPEEAAPGGVQVMQQLRKVGKRLGGAVGRRSVRRGRGREAEEETEAVSFSAPRAQRQNSSDKRRSF